MKTIAKLAFKEILYKKIFRIVVLMTLAFLAFYGTAIYYAGKEFSISFESGSRSMADLFIQQNVIASQLLGVGLYFSSFILALLTILSAVPSISSEIDSHQIDTWLARPLSRRSFILGKFIGLSTMFVLYGMFLFGGVLLVFQLFSGEFLSLSFEPLQLITSMLIFVLQPIVIIAISMLLSSRMTTVSGGIILIILYGVGFIGGFVEQIGALMENVTLINIGILSSLALPLDSLFRMTIIQLFETSDNPISFASQGLFGSVSAPSPAMIGYAIVYSAMMLFLAVRVFSERDV
ncbi:ABC transporter permease [Bacillus solimangrovi]|uniref:ABC transporter permease n=1 Tax=Bacillus solimangrovi TaxID=1305675 RepID=A0A1E5LHE7_9BACI|nr:ABC transporter permease subunit [Bacillus solimangrovi]OEH93497.1 hypothetical protein BFG57_00445 [Bacillus solimangrovi]